MVGQSRTVLGQESTAGRQSSTIVLTDIRLPVGGHDGKGMEKEMEWFVFRGSRLKSAGGDDKRFGFPQQDRERRTAI